MRDCDKVAMCHGKDQMPRSVAAKVAKRIRAEKECNVMPYRCKVCGHWRVGSRPKGMKA
jgi:hypothetical protein